jgi:hypothetical protein
MFSPKTLYIVGEVDSRVIQLDRPWFTKRNLCLRYASEYEQKPEADWQVNYEQDFNTRWVWLAQHEVNEVKQNYMTYGIREISKQYL